MYVVYKITNKVNGIIYIGATNNLRRRLNEHKNHSQTKPNGSEFYKAINKYGWDNFSVEIIEICENEEIMFVQEQYYIELFDARNPLIGYNLAKGGKGGQTHDVSGELNPQYGKKKTEKQKRQVSEQFKNVPKTEEHKAKISKTLKGKPKTEEHIAKRSHPITVINVFTKEVVKFKSKTQAERELHTNFKTLQNGGVTRKGWKLFVEEGQETTESIDSEKDTIE